MRMEPPGRGSISQTGLVNAFGPHHCLRRSTLRPRLENNRTRRASRMRVSTRSGTAFMPGSIRQERPSVWFAPSMAPYLATQSHSAADGKSIRMVSRVLSPSSARKRHRGLKSTRLGTRFRFMFVNQAFGSHDLEKDDSVLIVDSVGTAHDKSPHAAGLDVHLLNGGGKTFGPHHFATCFGSVQAAKTRSRGASKMRVKTSSRSVAVLVAAMLLLLF